MQVQLTDEQAAELRSVLYAALADLSAEIAGTDNPSYRAGRNARRDTLSAARAQLGVA